MITAERKPMEELIQCVKPYRSILLAGCNECVTVCAAGGRKEVGVLASALKMHFMKAGQPMEIQEITLERQCDPEYMEELVPLIDQVDAVLSMACGCGVQEVARRFHKKPVFPAVNTKFMGASEHQGVWAERCQGCGDCVLGSTGGVCPVARCSKQLFNGPCGGSTNGKCEVDANMDCAWQLIWDRLKALGTDGKVRGKPAGQRLASGWGRGAAENHQRGYGAMKTASTLEQILASGDLAVTSECGPPRGTSAEKVREKAELLRGYVDGVNVTDNQTAMVRMSSLAACILLKQMGLNPILQMVTRDRNRLAMQSDILGAYAHGIDTMLCLSGDHPHFGDHPMAATVHDIDSIQMIQMVKEMRDEGLFQGGDKIDEPPQNVYRRRGQSFRRPF